MSNKTILFTIQEWKINALSPYNDGFTQNYYREKLNEVYNEVKDVPKNFKVHKSNDISYDDIEMVVCLGSD